MPDREKVKNGLRSCLHESEYTGNDPCKYCPYGSEESGVDSSCIDEVMRDALELLKEQKPSVDEFQDFIYHEHFRQRLSAENLAYLNLWINKFKEDIVRKSADEKLMEEMDADPLG